MKILWFVCIFDDTLLWKCFENCFFLFHYTENFLNSRKNLAHNQTVFRSQTGLNYKLLLSCCDRLETGLCYCGCANVKRTLVNVFFSPIVHQSLCSQSYGTTQNFSLRFLIIIINALIIILYCLCSGMSRSKVILLAFSSSFAIVCVVCLSKVSCNNIFLIQQEENNFHPIWSALECWKLNL